MQNKKLTCVIVDDEEFSIELLMVNLKLVPALSLLKTYTNPLKALAEIRKEDNIDILFLDIDMPQLNGLNLAESLRNKVKHIIFTTAFSQYSLQAFGVKAYDYLLKPVDEVKFIETINEILEQENTSVTKRELDVLFIKGDAKGKYISIKLADIILIYIEGHKLHIETIKERYQTTESLKNIAERLPNDNRFFKVHQANIINTEKIISINGNMIFMQNKFKVPISEHYKNDFIAFISTKISSPK